MPSPIRKGSFVTKEQARQINAALILAGTDRKAWASDEELSYQRVNRMVRGEEMVTASYARRFNALVKRRLGSRLAQAA